MTEDYNCKLCGAKYEDEDELNVHKREDHSEFTEMYGKEEGRQVGSQWVKDHDHDFDNGSMMSDGFTFRQTCTDPECDAVKDQDVLMEADGTKEKDDDPQAEIMYPWRYGDTKDDADEIDQQEDKPTQSHDDWLEDLKGLKDEFATEQEKCAICNGEHPTSEHPVLEETHEDEEEKKEGEEEGGADDPLKKVADLAESYRFMSRDKRTNIFESLGFGQRDSAILSGLEWNELTRPIKVEASEAYSKEQNEEEEKLEKYSRVNDEDEEEDKAYESLYNIEKYHSSPDYKKKNLTCNKCNESFYNGRDRDVHFNEVHATGQEYELPDQCPFCKEIIQEPETLDWHMQEEHGAHVPSQFTQTGIAGAMTDTDFDSLESYKRATERSIKEACKNVGCTVERAQQVADAQGMDLQQVVDAGNLEDMIYSQDQDEHWASNIYESYAREAKWECLDCDQKFDDAGKHQDETGHHNITRSHASEGQGGSDDKYDFESHKANESRSKAKEVTGDYWWGNHVKWESGMDQDFLYCNHCGQDLYVDASYHGDGSISDENVNEVVQTHMRNHGITESYAKEDEDWIEKHYDRIKSDGLGILFKCKFCGELIEDYDTDAHLDIHGVSESRASDLKKEIRKQKEFINIASIENPMNMGDAEDKLNNLESELESLGGEELEGTEEEGQEDARSTMKTQKDILDRSEDYDPTLELKYGYPWQEGGEGEGGHQDLEDTTEYPEDDYEWIDGKRVKKKSTEEDEYLESPSDRDVEERERSKRKKFSDPLTWSEEDGYVDDSDNAKENYVCPDCDEEFNTDEQLKGHQYSYYHGKYKDEGEGEDMPRNEIGGY